MASDSSITPDARHENITKTPEIYSMCETRMYCEATDGIYFQRQANYTLCEMLKTAVKCD